MPYNTMDQVVKLAQNRKQVLWKEPEKSAILAAFTGSLLTLESLATGW
jgi:hypothetical protein